MVYKEKITIITISSPDGSFTKQGNFYWKGHVLLTGPWPLINSNSLIIIMYNIIIIELIHVLFYVYTEIITLLFFLQEIMFYSELKKHV